MFSTNQDVTSAPQVFAAGIDVDGQLRGKFIPGDKARTGKLPFCSVVFGWDCNDQQYEGQGTIADADTGFGDLDLHLDWDSQWDFDQARQRTALILGYFTEPGSTEHMHSCPRGLLRTVLKRSDYTAKAGCELEFYNFENSSKDIAEGKKLVPLDQGNHGYSLLRTTQDISYWNLITRACESLRLDFDTYHAETGPGVLECALKYDDVAMIADKITLFKYKVRTCAQGQITPCFMAKPMTGMPGNSGHLHCSLWNKEEPVFAAKSPTSFFPETKFLSEEGHYFLGGLLEALPDIMLMFAPNINSYRRLDPNFWAPTTVSWGVDNRLSSIRLVDCHEKAKSIRFEVRIPGADLVPHFALAAIYAAGYRGIDKKIKPTIPPVRTKADILNSDLLPSDLGSAIHKFSAPRSLARELFGNGFVDHYAGTRKHELNMYRKQVSEWEFKRYVETA